MPESLHDLDLALDDALEEVRSDFAERLQLVAYVDRVLSERKPESPELELKNRIVEAVVRMRLGEFDRARVLLEALCGRIPPAEFPELRFRCQTMQAVLLLIDGNRSASLTAFKDILEGDLTGVSQRLVSRSNISYAAILNENGRSAEAADLYEQLMIKSLANEDDALTLLAGNNLTVILITQGDYLAARQTLDELSPVLQRNPDSLVRASLILHDLELSRVHGDIDRAIEGLSAFIESGGDGTPLMVGSAHRLLADALRDAGRLEEAQTQAQQAIELLSRQAHERSEAYLSLVQIRMEQRDYSGVLAEIAQIDLEEESVPARQVLVHRLRLEALLRQEGDPEKIAAFDALISADGTRDLLASTTRAEYFEARLVAARQSLELERAEALAAAAVEKSQISARNQNLLLGFMAAAALALCLLVYVLVNRRSERLRLQEKQQQNENLELLVEEKTQELTANLNARAEMARALERTKRTEAIGLLAGNVAHDFNNLLQVVASGNETLRNADTSAEERANVLSLSDKSLGYASRIIRQLLAYARQQDLAAYPLRLSRYLNETQALFESVLGERNLLAIEDDSHEANILVDPTQLTTSILNLISNSADAMPTGGKLTLNAQVRSLDDEQAQRWNDITAGDYLVIGVQDTGIGMSQQQVARACEPFYTTKGPQSGTGLGLSSVYGFVKQSGGDLKIHSVPNEGTLVQFLLPVTQQEESAVQPAESGSEVKLSGGRVMLVEDNDAVARMLESVLRKVDLHTVRVASGQEAKAYLQNDADFDYLLSDVRMPGELDGPALARWVQTELPTIQVLLMSGYSELGAGDADLPLIRKPFSVTQLTQFIAEHSAKEEPEELH